MDLNLMHQHFALTFFYSQIAPVAVIFLVKLVK